ncbi:type IV toxin-antitoxin system AbiEi family antitoxin [Laspinema sp. D1]|uniref:Type IV toxin-antitoxin system AbiEi family antitoxin n=1 Tax=Laspinema palackyanum D2a TaxID=2953684 RepID=A0ABT2MXT3_9CYAN|nr:type IV toxin-antitoxin system AbiEi family antitoxin [Laspinema sp. D2a]
MKQESPLLRECLDHMNALPDIEARNGDRNSITIRNCDKSVDYAYKIQPDVTGTTAELIIPYFQRFERNNGDKILLITRYLSNPAIDILLEKQIEFIDTAGNIYLNNPAAYILIRGQRRPKGNPLSRSKITVTTLKLIYILLKNPHILQATVGDIAAAAGIASSTVLRSLQDLYELGYLQRQRDGNYRIVNYPKLLERWEMGYAESLRPQLIVEAFTPAGEESFSDVAERLMEGAKEGKFLLGGELGAAIATDYLRPQSATLHLVESGPQTSVKSQAMAIAAKMRLKPNLKGNIVFVQQFGKQNVWSEDGMETLADPLLLHAELLLIPDERSQETADRLYTNSIAPRQHNA